MASYRKHLWRRILIGATTSCAHVGRRLGVALALSWAFASTSSGVTFTVNSPASDADAMPGDGTCETVTGNGICTLPAAIQEANAFAGFDAVELPPGTYPGPISVTEDLALSAEDPATTMISDLVSTAGAQLSISRISLSGGLLVGTELCTSLVPATVTVDRCIIGGDGVRIICSEAPSSIANSTITTGSGTGLFLLAASATIADTTISGNETGVHVDAYVAVSFTRVSIRNNVLGIDAVPALIGSMTLNDCDVVENGTGIHTGTTEGWGLHLCIDHSEISRNTGHGIAVGGGLEFPPFASVLSSVASLEECQVGVHVTDTRIEGNGGMGIAGATGLNFAEVVRSSITGNSSDGCSSVGESL